MNLTKTAFIAAALLGGVIAAPHQASALTADPAVKAPSAVEAVACRVTRVVGPRGVRTTRVCDARPAFVRPRPRCVTERQRVIRPNGVVVFKTVRRCR